MSSNGRIHERDSFHNFFDHWMTEQNHHLQELLTAAKDGGSEEMLRPVVARVLKHYEHYYKAKSRWAQNHALSMFKPSWLSSLEDAYLWIGGWRPTMAFHLLYSESGLQVEARLDELMRGISIGELGDLSPSQYAHVDELQRETIREERDKTEELAGKQEAVADSSMVEMAHAVAPGPGRVKATLACKEESMLDILHKADDLRLKTLRKLLAILSPRQAVHFLIAAATLHLRVHEWGVKRDAARPC